MRWASNGIGLTSWIRWTTGRPRERFGTKWLSITSTCTASAVLILWSSDWRFAKSAERMLGLMQQWAMDVLVVALVGRSGSWCQYGPRLRLSCGSAPRTWRRSGAGAATAG